MGSNLIRLDDLPHEQLVQLVALLSERRSPRERRRTHSAHICFWQRRSHRRERLYRPKRQRVGSSVREWPSNGSGGVKHCVHAEHADDDQIGVRLVGVRKVRRQRGSLAARLYAAAEASRLFHLLVQCGTVHYSSPRHSLSE